MQLDKINELPKIPMLRTPVFRDIEIAGKTVRVHKARARQAAVVATRLLESYGETLLSVFASPDSDLATIAGDGESVSDSAMLKSLLAGGFMPQISGRLRELGLEQGPDHMLWYIQQLLFSNVELEGYLFKDLDEFDAAGFGFEELLRIFWIAVELCIYPTSDDPATADGSSQSKPAEPNPEPQKARRGRKRSVAKSKAGQSVPMSASQRSSGARL